MVSHVKAPQRFLATQWVLDFPDPEAGNILGLNLSTEVFYVNCVPRPGIIIAIKR